MTAGCWKRGWRRSIRTNGRVRSCVSSAAKSRRKTLASQAADPDPGTAKKQDCEASFYSGALARVTGDAAAAKAGLEHAHDVCSPENIEYHAAQARWPTRKRQAACRAVSPLIVSIISNICSGFSNAAGRAHARCGARKSKPLATPPEMTITGMLGLRAAQRRQQLEAVHLRHVQIGDNRRGRLGLDGIQTLESVACVWVRKPNASITEAREFRTAASSSMIRMSGRQASAPPVGKDTVLIMPSTIGRGRRNALT